MSACMKVSGLFSSPFRVFYFACSDPLAPLPGATQSVHKIRGPCNNLGNAQIAILKNSASPTGLVTKLNTWWQHFFLHIKEKEPEINQSRPNTQLLVEFFSFYAYLSFIVFLSFQGFSSSALQDFHSVILPQCTVARSLVSLRKLASTMRLDVSECCSMDLRLGAFLI